MKSFFVRYFFKCDTCGFLLSLLAQANRQVEHTCPCCGEGDLDYASQADRKRYVRALRSELEDIKDDEL